MKTILKITNFTEDYGYLFALLIVLILLFISLFNPNLISSINTNASNLIIAIVALLVVKGELSAQRRIHSERLNFEKDQYARASTYINKINNLAYNLASQIAVELEKNDKWAGTALERANLSPQGRTLFSERLNHYREEKQFLAKKFAPILAQRCKHILEQDETAYIYLIIDSGTTLYPIFEEMAKYFMDHNSAFWKERLLIVTNNLPGIQLYMESARISPRNRYSELVVDCYILPGAPLPAYSAIAGESTRDALSQLKKKAKNENKKPIFIGLITGNFVRLRNSNPHCPIPLSRGPEHHEFKVHLIDSCDEIFVLAPLGKVLWDIKKSDINEKFGFSKTNPNSDMQPYLEHEEITNEKAAQIKLVTTKRAQNLLLYEHSLKVEKSLIDELKGGFDTSNFKTIKDHFVNDEIFRAPHLFFPYNNLPSNFDEQDEIEFPHDFISDEVKKELFSIKSYQ